MNLCVAGSARAVVLLAVLGLLPAGAAADSKATLAIARKMREQGMSQWRNGDFLSAYGNCFGARQVLVHLQGIPQDVVANGVGYAELCMGLALQQMNIRSKNHNPCRMLLQAQKNFRLVDQARKAQGKLAEDGGYLAEMLKDSGCKK
jgi:hypothetical protein